MIDGTETNKLLTAALEYAARGWHVVPLRGRGKRPWLAHWEREASADEERVTGWWGERPTSNVGVQLGPRSGIVDVEGDEAESEADYALLFGADAPICPTFQSSRGKHRLYAWTDDLPPLAVVHLGAIEIRLGGGDRGAQTVFPPSIHPEGGVYQWLVSPDEVDPPPLPEAVVTAIWNRQGGRLDDPTGGGRRSADDWERITEGVAEGDRNESAAAWIGRLLAGVADVFGQPAVLTAWDATRGWNRGNRPPLDEDELRRTFDSILARERRKRSGTGEAAKHNVIRRDPETGEMSVEGWRLVIVASEPPVFRLHSPLWEGYVELTSADMRSVGKIGQAVLDQKQFWLPRWFGRFWEGGKDRSGVQRPSAAAVLIDRAQTVEADSDVVRTAIVAAAILEFLDTPRPWTEDQKPETAYRTMRLEDGSIVWKFNRMHERLSRGPDKITRNELVRVLDEVGRTIYRCRDAGQTRLQRLTTDGLSLLRQLTLSKGGGTP